MSAYLDRPGERERDLGDLAHLIGLYVDDDDDRRFGDEVPAADLDFEDVPAFLAGRDVGAICSGAHRATLEHFLDVVTASESAIGLMRRDGPLSWRRDEGVRRGLGGFRRGLGEVETLAPSR
jgi:predicted nucleotidyltransferase